MRANGDITLYHYQQDGTYSKTVYQDVCTRQSAKMVPSKNGMDSAGFTTVRIATTKDICLELGDYVLIGVSDWNAPDKAACKKVIGVADNRSACSPMLRHWRIDCT